MSRGTGTHFSSPVLGGDGPNAAGGLYEDVPIDLLSRIHRLGFFTDFVEADSATVIFTNTNTGAGAGQSTAYTSGGTNGLFTLQTGTTINTGVQSQMDATNIGGFIVPSASAAIDGVGTARSFSFGCRLNFAAAAAQNSDWFIGLAGVDASILALATGLVTTPGLDNGVGFHHIGPAAGTQGGIVGPDGTDFRFAAGPTAVANYQAVLASAGNVRPVPAGSLGAAAHEFGIRVRGLSTVEFYFDGVLRHRMALGTAFSTVAMTPSFAITAGTAANRTMSIDYLWAASTR